MTAAPGQSEDRSTDGRGHEAPPAGEADVHAEVAEEVADRVTRDDAASQGGPAEHQHVSDEVAADRAAEAQAAAHADESAHPAEPGLPAGEADIVTEGVATDLAAERLMDLQRVQAEYVNYRRRVERDRSVAREGGVTSVLESLLGVLDDIELSRRHGDLEGGPFAAIAEKLESSLGRFGLARYGTSGEAFDPTVHEALMHAHSDEVEVATVTQVLQPGYTVHDRVLRAARVAVSDPH